MHATGRCDEPVLFTYLHYISWWSSNINPTSKSRSPKRYFIMYFKSKIFYAFLVSSMSKQLKEKHSHYSPWRCLRERMYSSYSFLTSVQEGVSGQHHAPAVLYPGERTAGTHLTGGWAGPRPRPNTEATGKILCLCRGLNPDRPSSSP
jgi:hypothetical protein